MFHLLDHDGEFLLGCVHRENAQRLLYTYPGARWMVDAEDGSVVDERPHDALARMAERAGR